MVHFVHKVIALLALLLLTVGSTFGQNIEKEMKKEADKLFADEQYVAATSTYLSLLSLYPSSSEYNYKYGACLLFNSAKKQTAIKFLATAVTDPLVDPIAYYFLGKAYHLNFQFNSAITNYQVYLTKSSDEVRKKEVRRQLEMCENGKNLLRQLSDLVVLEKKESDPQNFFRSYNLENIGGSIVVAADFQSKIDVKRKHIPLIYFPATSDTVYFSSYGDVDKGNKDIYYKTRTAAGTWSSAQTVKGMVNTNEDEDYPFLSADGQLLYFSSKGHNSMGGFDVFRSERVAGKHAFSTPINCDFAISTPDDDLFYITDSLGKHAYFASSRQSENGKVVVYKVRVTRVPSQLLVGDFTFEDEEQAAQLKASSELKPNAEKYSDAQFAFASKWSDIARDFGSPTATPVELKQNVNKLISDKETFVTAVTAVQQTVLVQLTDLIEEAQVHAENATKSYELAQTATSDSLRANALEETIFQLDFQQELMVTIRQLKSFDAELTTLRTGENTAIKQLKKSVDAVELAENDQTTELLVQALEQLAGILKPLDKSPPLSLEGHINDQKVALSLQKQVIETSLASNRITALSLNDTLQKLNASLTQAKSKNQSEISQSIALYKDELSAVESQIKRKEAQVKVFNDSLQYLSDRLNFTQLPGRNITIDSIGLQAALKAIQRAPLANFDQLSQASSQELSALKEKMGQATFVAESAANETNLKVVTEVIPNENNTKTSDEKVIEPVLNPLTTIEQDSSIVDINPVPDVDTATTKATSETVNSVPDVQTTTSELSSETANPVAVYAKIEALLLPNYTEKSQQLLLQNDSVSLEKYRALTLEYLAIIDDALADSLETTNALTLVLYPEDRTSVLKALRLSLTEQLTEAMQVNENVVQAELLENNGQNTQPSTVFSGEKENPIIVQIRPNYYQRLTALSTVANDSSGSKQRALYDEERALLADMQQAIRVTEKAIKKDTSTLLKEQLAAYQLQETLIDARVAEQQSALVFQLISSINQADLLRSIVKDFHAINFDDSLRWTSEELLSKRAYLAQLKTEVVAAIIRNEQVKSKQLSLEKIAENQVLQAIVEQLSLQEHQLETRKERETVAERESERETETERETVAERESERETETERETVAERETETETERERENSLLIADLIAKYPKKSVSSPFSNVLQTSVSFEEERTIIAASIYGNLLMKWQAIGLEKIEVAQLTSELDQTFTRIKLDPSDKTEQANYFMLINKIEAINNSILEKEIELIKQIPSKISTVDKWKNVLYREVLPQAKTIVSPEPIVQETKQVDFVLIPQKTQPSKPIVAVPISEQNQSGLIYSVQVGALSKPPLPSLFQEFTPITSELLANGITRYLAGTFNNQQAVQTAHQQIKKLGYSDAFIVAYCDGQRISFAEARQLEASKKCVPTTQNTLAFQNVAQETIRSVDENGGIQPVQQTTKTEQVVQQTLKYNQAPGAVFAQQLENEKGLFYTVQIGVFNRPVPAEQVKNLDSLYTLRLPNGQIRYCTGKYTSINAAKPKRSLAQTSGISDAFITVYWNGERISFEAAARIISEQGTAVFTVNVPKVEPIIRDTVTAPPTQPEPKLDVEEISYEDRYFRFVSAETFSIIPEAFIAELGAFGAFYFDTLTGKVVSTEKEIGSEAIIPNGMLRELLSETERNGAAVVLTVRDSSISGTFADWLLHANLPIEIKQQGNKTIFYIVLKDKKTAQVVRDYLNEHKIVDEYQLRMNELK